MKTLIQKAIDICGSQTALAEKCGVKQPYVHNWLNRDKQLTLERAIQIEKATNREVLAHDLRPDFFD